jgi:hypothetical protein
MPPVSGCRWARTAAGRGVVVPERLYRLPAGERDRLIVALRKQGWSLARIGRRVGMSRGGVLRALERIERGDPGVDRRE